MTKRTAKPKPIPAASAATPTSRHGIAIRDRKTKRLVRFVHVTHGTREALTALPDVRKAIGAHLQAEWETLDAAIVEELRATPESGR